MNIETLHTQLSTIEYAAFREAAKRHAVQTRMEAIDQFWSELGGRLATAGTTLLSTLKQSRQAACRQSCEPAGH